MMAFCLLLWMQLSGGEEFVEAAVDMLKRVCLHQLSSNVSLYSNDDATVSDTIQLIQQQLCFDQCQPHGHCHNGN